MRGRDLSLGMVSAKYQECGQSLSTFFLYLAFHFHRIGCGAQKQSATMSGNSNETPRQITSFLLYNPINEDNTNINRSYYRTCGKKLYKETFSDTSLWYYDLHREDFGVKIWNEDR